MGGRSGGGASAFRLFAGPLDPVDSAGLSSTMLMRVRILLFASYRDLTGANQVELDLPVEATARVAIARLRDRGTAFARIPAEPAVAVNLEYASLDVRLADGDELALIPPVAGG